MKTLLPLLITLIFGISALAQNPSDNGKVVSIQMDVVLVVGHKLPNVQGQTTQMGQDQVARLYRYKYARVKKALQFNPQPNNPKLA